MKHVIISIFFVLVSTSCGKPSREILIQAQWKYKEGYSIGDFLLFSGESKYCSLNGDTIYVGTQPKATIVTWDKRTVKIRALDNNSTGEYALKY